MIWETENISHVIFQTVSLLKSAKHSRKIKAIRCSHAALVHLQKTKQAKVLKAHFLQANLVNFASLIICRCTKIA